MQDVKEEKTHKGLFKKKGKKKRGVEEKRKGVDNELCDSI